MKRAKEGERMMEPMFPRLHVNDTEKGGPRAPPRNKMALYEQLSIPSQRFTHSNNMATNLAPPSSQMHPSYLSEQQYSQYSDLSTPLAQVERRNKLDEDDYTVPIFIHSIPSKESDTYSTNNDREKISPPNPTYFHHSLKLQTAMDNIAALEREKIYSSNSGKVLSTNRNVCNDNGQKGNLVRRDSVTETSILDIVSELDMSPDDVVGVIGEKHFWKARKAIVNQQRVFAVQVFELHRLIKVQKLIAASPHLLGEDSACFTEPINPLPAKELSSDSAIKAIQNIRKRKGEFEKPTRKNESSGESTIEKASPSPAQNGQPFFDQPQGPHHWLIPVMSPSEGLVYKPYPGPGFLGGQSCGGPNPVMANFLPPAYGVPAPHPQYHFPSFPPLGHFPPYSMPIMNSEAFSGSSVEQTNWALSQNNRPGPVSGDVGVQASTASSACEKRVSSRASRGVEGENMLPLFPTAVRASNSDPQVSAPEGPTQVIKVVPRNGVSASESAARIFRSIQAERRQYDSA